MPRGAKSKNAKAKGAAEPTGRIERGSGNVFADLKLPNPDLALAKAQLVQQIRELITERKLTQTEAGRLLGLDQPKVSALLRAASKATASSVSFGS